MVNVARDGKKQADAEQAGLGNAVPRAADQNTAAAIGFSIFAWESPSCFADHPCTF